MTTYTPLELRNLARWSLKKAQCPLNIRHKLTLKAYLLRIHPGCAATPVSLYVTGECKHHHMLVDTTCAIEETI
jgi:hypothetical protein